MNFSSHKNHVADLIEIALTKNKQDLVARFKIILNKCSGLFKSEDFNFWLKQIGSMPCDEIPITKFGLQEASLSLKDLRDLNRHSFKSRVLFICEQLFTYSNQDDLCSLQTAYHYYFYFPEQRIFKESEMGDCDLAVEKFSRDQIRIAKMSELEVDQVEYI